jgi:hypothetical protein
VHVPEAVLRARERDPLVSGRPDEAVVVGLVRGQLVLENAALRHQLAVLSDRMVWILFRRG